MIVELLTAAGLFTATQTPGTDQNWRAITRTDNVVMGVERNSVNKTGEEVTFLMLNAWRRSNAGAYAVMEVRLNCSTDTFRAGERRSYDADGHQIGVFSSEAPVARVEPGSTMSIVAAAVCDDIWPSLFSTPTRLEFYQRSMVELEPGR